VNIRLRPILAVAACAALAAATGVATAAPKPVCNVVTDPKGDAAIVTQQDGLDVVSGDIASNAKTITAVIRLGGAPGGGNPQAIGGTRYYFEFTPTGATRAQYLYASVPFLGEPTFHTGEITVETGRSSFSTDPTPVTGSIKGNLITISAPMAAFSRASLKPKKKLGTLTVETFALASAGGRGLLIAVDEALGKTYVAGTPSCLKP
jgi:hypothetical protein